MNNTASDIGSTSEYSCNEKNQITKQNQFISNQQKQLDIFVRKNNDYGDAVDMYGSVGIMVRLQDKLNRYINLNKDKTTISMVKDESIIDTLNDLSNYSNLLIMNVDFEKSTAKRQI